MTTEKQTKANRENAKHSTGPRTQTGREKSAINALTLGLYTRQDYVRPDERDLYAEFCETMYAELTPAGLLEQSLVSEITAASWRLRRCYNAEGVLADYATADPLLDGDTEKKRKSIERARLTAHSVLHRSLNQLRKLQTERVTREQLGIGNADDTPLADSRKVCQALNIHTRNQKLFAEAASEEIDRALSRAMSASEVEQAVPPVSGLSDDATLIPTETDSQTAAPRQMASICEEPAVTGRIDKIRIGNSLCPCHSGLIDKKCCGKTNYENEKQAA